MQGKETLSQSFSRPLDTTDGASGSTHRRENSYDDNFNYPYCHDISKYEKLCKIGQGTFG